MRKDKAQLGFTLIEVMLLLIITISCLLLFKISQNPIDPKHARNTETVDDRQRLAEPLQSASEHLVPTPKQALAQEPKTTALEPAMTSKSSVEETTMSPSNLAIVETLGLFGLLLAGLALFARRLIKKAGLAKTPTIGNTH